METSGQRTRKRRDKRTKDRADERKGGCETMGTRDELTRDEEGVRRVILAM